MRETKLKYYRCGLSVAIVGLALPSYYVRELLVSFALFTVAFFFLALVALGALLAWWASEQLIIWTEAWSPSVFAFSNHLISAYVKSWAPKEPRSRIGDCADENRPLSSSSPEYWLGESKPDFGASILTGASLIPSIDQLGLLPPKVPFVELQVH